MANTNISTDASIGRVNSYSGSRAGPRVFRSAQSVVTKIRNKQRQLAGNDILAFPEDMPKYHMVIRTAQYKRKDFFELNYKVTNTGTIYLPLPVSGMVDSHEIDYTEEALGMAGAGVQAGLNQTTDSNPSDKTGGGSLWGFALNAITQAADAFTGGNVSGTTYALAGIAPSKFMTILLKGPRYKRHEFTWKLYPRNFREANKINDIVIRMNDKAAVGLSSGGLLWSFPDVFYIEYVPNPKYLYKFKPMVLEVMTANYAPGGTPSFYHGQNGGGDNDPSPPECIEIKARFLELEYWLKDQYTNSNDASPTGPHRMYGDKDAAIGKKPTNVGPDSGNANSTDPEPLGPA